MTYNRKRKLTIVTVPEKTLFSEERPSESDEDDKPEEVGEGGNSEEEGAWKEEGACCFCRGPCNLCSQACGRCIRRPSRMCVSFFAEGYSEGPEGSGGPEGYFEGPEGSGGPEGSEDPEGTEETEEHLIDFLKVLGTSFQKIDEVLSQKSEENLRLPTAPRYNKRKYDLAAAHLSRAKKYFEEAFTELD